MAMQGMDTAPGRNAHSNATAPVPVKPVAVMPSAKQPKQKQITKGGFHPHKVKV